MSLDLPNLNALRAFEVAARLGSFKAAADELHVSHAAVSRHIKVLEQQLGLALFLRQHRGVVLTRAGRRYFDSVRTAFDAIAEATRRSRSGDDARRLVLSCEPGIAARWLVRRLRDFRERHPAIEIDIVSSTALVTLPDGRIDAMLVYGRSPQEGLRQDHLMTLRAFPVCSPKFLRGRHALKQPSDLRHVRLLHEQSHDWWRMWLDSAGVTGVAWNAGPIYYDYNLAVNAAIAGEGVIIGDDLLTYDDIREGRLVVPFALTRPTGSYHLVCHQTLAENPAMQAFRAWLLRESRKQARASAALVPEPKGKPVSRKQ